MRQHSVLVVIVLFLHIEVQGEPGPEPIHRKSYGISSSPRSSSSSPSHQEALTKYLLTKLLGNNDNEPQSPFSQRRDSDSSFRFPLRNQDPLQKLLDHAKANIDVIDFRNPDRKYLADDHIKLPRRQQDLLTEDIGPDLFRVGPESRSDSSSPSQAVPVFLPFPGNEKSRPTRQISPPLPSLATDSREPFTMPLQKLGGKQYYIGIFFKANWYKAEQFCRYHNMHLASINSEEEQKMLEEYVTGYGMGNEHFWSSGTDQGEEGRFVWMSTGKPLTYENWNAGEPNNFQYENGETENCLELWNRDGKGLRWNDTPCSFESYFVCEL